MVFTPPLPLGRLSAGIQWDRKRFRPGTVIGFPFLCAPPGRQQQIEKMDGLPLSAILFSAGRKACCSVPS